MTFKEWSSDAMGFFSRLSARLLPGLPKWERRSASDRESCAAYSGPLAAALPCYQALIYQARQSCFYRDGNIPDSLEGRFDLIALHLFLILHRLRDDHDPRAAAFMQALIDLWVADMDQSLREMGAGDMGVGPRVKTMVSALYGRIAAYEAALKAGKDALQTALWRNLYADRADARPVLPLFADYVQSALADIGRQELSEILAGRPHFPQNWPDGFRSATLGG